MKALVVYESHWGNTAAAARAVADGIGPETPVLSTGEADASAVESVDLLVVGAPVLAFRLATPGVIESMRVKPGKGTPPDLSHPTVRSWLESLPAGTGATAAFDTRVRGPFGSAAPAILEGLERAGYRRIAEPAGFKVKGQQGPLRDGELERARQWGKELAAGLNLRARSE